MVKKKIIVTISPEGEVKIDAVGYSGARCEQATAHIEKALGLKEKHRAVKPEFYNVRRSQEVKS